MFTLIRKIRKKLIEQGKLRNYLFYAVGEIILVVIGIFQNDDQIGLIDKNKKVVLGGDEYILQINSDQIDPIIAIGFVIAYDCQYRNNKESVIRLDLGNKSISPVKIADENWSPKK